MNKLFFFIIIIFFIISSDFYDLKRIKTISDSIHSKDFDYKKIEPFNNFNTIPSTNNLKINLFSFLSPNSIVKDQFILLYDFNNFEIDDKSTESFLDCKTITHILKQLGFKYYDKINSEFKLLVHSIHGKFEKIIVTKDGEYAFIIRRKKDFSFSFLEENESLNLLELNPFTGKKAFKNQELGGQEIFEGYCKYSINKKHNHAYLGPSQTYSIEIPIYKNKGLGSLLLSHALENCFIKGVKKITVYSPTPKAISFYKKFGFQGDKDLHLNLERYYNLLNLNKAKWTTEKVSAIHLIRNADFRFKNVNGEYFKNINLKMFTEKILNNFLIEEFNEFDNNVPQLRTKPLIEIAYDFLSSDNIKLINLIETIENKGNDFIILQGKKILKNFSKNYSGLYKTTSSWKKFMQIKTLGEYDFKQLLSHSLTAAIGFQDMMHYDENDENIINKFNDYAGELWIILRAVDIEASTSAPSIKNSFQTVNNDKRIKKAA